MPSFKRFMPSFKRFAVTLLALSASSVLHYHWVAKLELLPYVLPVHAAPFAPGEAPKPFKRRIVAVGDLHGDYDEALKVLKFSHVINEKKEWSGDVDFFVQIGDIMDRAAYTIDLFQFLDKLRADTNTNGGVVISLLGNHEWMNAIGDWRYVVRDEIYRFDSFEVGENEWKDAIYWDKDSSDYTRGFGKRMVTVLNAAGSFGSSLAQNYQTASRLPLHPSLGPPDTPYNSPPPSPKLEDDLSHAALSFVHAGLSPSYLKGLGPFPTAINKISDSLLKRLQDRKRPRPGKSHRDNDKDGLPGDAPEEEKRLYAESGPLRYDGWATRTDEEQLCKDADTVLRMTGTRRMIMGHTFNPRIISRCEGKILIIDTGISRAFSRGQLSALSIEYTLEPIEKAENPDDHWIWEEREIVTALYAGSREMLVNATRKVVGNFIIPSK